jgi:hypothetical protein
VKQDEAARRFPCHEKGEIVSSFTCHDKKFFIRPVYAGAAHINPDKKKQRRNEES